MKPTLAHSPQKPKRRAPDLWRAGIRKYAASIGELLWSANRAQASFCDLFTVLVDPRELEAGIAIWFTIQSDRSQLAALEALIAVRYKPKSRIALSTIWAVAAAGKLATIRNDAAHMATSPRTTDKGVTFIPNFLANPVSRLQRRDNQDFLRIFDQARGDYVQLQQYIHDIFCHLTYPTGSYPRPLRPKLKSVVVGKQRKT